MKTMKEKELRFGNYIMAISDKVIETVIKLEKNKINACNDTYFIPIPLTEDWLIKFGFIDVSHDKNGLGLRKRMQVFGIEMCFNKYEEHIRLQTIKSGYTIQMLGIKYVHQLQNLYFALTGEELTIK